MLKIGDTLKAVVFATPPYGIYLRDVNHPKIDILVSVTEVSWSKTHSPSEYTQVGAILEIKIIFVSEKDDTTASATIVGEEIANEHDSQDAGHADELNVVAALRQERDQWRNDHHALNVDLMQLRTEKEEVLQALAVDRAMRDHAIKRAEKAEAQLASVEEEAPNVNKFVVRLYDGMDNVWMDVSKPVSKEEADRIWNQKTDNGTKKTKFDDIDYFNVFPADTNMVFRDR